MSEHLKHTPEKSAETLDLSAERKEHKSRIEQEREQNAPEQLDTTEIRSKIEQQAISGQETTSNEKPTAPAPSFGEYADIKQQTYKKTLSRIQSRLSPSEKTLSKVTHQKTVDTVSGGLSKTAARPSGILGGGIVALLGSTILLYMAKKYGFEYNFFFFFVLLAAGFIIGVVLEFLIHAIRRTRR